MIGRSAPNTNAPPISEHQENAHDPQQSKKIGGKHDFPSPHKKISGTTARA
jgi:hypothetical protein